MKLKSNLYPVLLIGVSLFFFEKANSQAVLTGMIMDSKTDSALSGSTVYNKSKQIYKKAFTNGYFTIVAMEGDTVIFSHINYRSDTIMIEGDLLSNGLYLGLKALPYEMKKVTIFGNTFAQDSLSRRQNYSSSYNYTKGVFSSSTPTSGFGVKVSPFSYFSREGRNKRNRRRQLEYEEQQSLIDFQFTSSLVHRTTNLSGETLQLFMRKYRPTYSFVRQANSEDMLRYINDSYKQFKVTE